MVPRACYFVCATPRSFVCATPRSGTQLLTGLLKSTGIAGRPEEYFWRDGRAVPESEAELACGETAATRAPCRSA